MTSSLTPCLLDQDNLQAAQAFAIRTRQLLFPEVYQTNLPHDLTHFDETYVVSPMGACFIIKDGESIVAMVAYRSYDARFDLELPSPCVEVVKLFVEPHYRRQGLASRLCQALFEYARTQNIRHFYLHTHPFLPAAEYFWQQQGFHLIRREWIQDYDTLHMLKSI